MPLTVQVQNFQSIKDATIIIEGFTVVSGANNSGKTALQRAIRGVFTNPPATALVRHGASHLSVTITFPDGQTVTWEKGKNVNRYILNGKDLGTIGKGVPEEVLALGVHPITAGNEKIWPQIAQQFVGQVFLLDRPGSMLAEAVADVEKVGQLSAALKLAEKDRRTAISDLRVRRKDETDLQAEYAGYAGLDGVESAVSAVETLVSDARTARGQLALLRKLRSQITQAEAEVERLAGIEEVPVPDEELAVEARQAQTDLSTLTDLRTRLKTAREDVTRWNEATKVATVPEDKTEAAKSVRTALKFFKGLRDDMSDARDKVGRLEKKLSTEQADLDAEQITVNEVLGEFDYCPTCQTPIGSSGHDHGGAT